MLSKIVEIANNIQKEAERIQAHGGDMEHYEELEYIKLRCKDIRDIVDKTLKDKV